MYEPKTYEYKIPANPQIGLLPYTAKIHFMPELYNSHFLENFTRRCALRSPIFMDIETTGLKIGAEDYQVRMIQVGNRAEAFCIPDVNDNIDLIYDALLRGTCPVGTQGGVFDWTSLMVMYGIADIDCTRFIDTKMEAHHWDPRTRDPYTKAPGHSLYALQKMYVHEDVAEDIKKAPTRRAQELKITLEQYFKTVALDDPEYVMYAGMDVITTSIVHEQLDRKLKASYANGIHSQELMDTDKEDFYNCILMGARGMKTDRPYYQELSDTYTRAEKLCQEKAEEEYGLTALGSTKQLAAIFTEAGKPPLKKTKGGAPKVDKVELQRQSELGHGLADIVMEGKKAQKWNNTFVKGILEASSRADRIHPKFDPLGARTGRYSSSEPNMQNLPGQVDDIRNGLIVDYPDTETGCSLDYQSQELRLLAAVSQDPQLILDIIEGRKPAELLAERIYGKGRTEVQYTKTKNTLYGMIYGGGAKTLAEQAGIPIEETKAVMKAFFDMYPQTKEYSNYLAGIARKDGYVKNLAGRLLIVDPNRTYSALNYMMQSTGRELIAAAVRDIMKSRWANVLRLVVHDEIVTIAPIEHIDEMIRELSEMMDAEINGIRFPVGARVWGERWVGNKH